MSGAPNTELVRRMTAIQRRIDWRGLEAEIRNLLAEAAVALTAEVDDEETPCTASCDDWPCHYIHPSP